MSLRPRKDGEHLGPKRTMSAAKVAEALGLKDATAPEPPPPDSPAAARLRAAGDEKGADALMEDAKENYMTRIVPAGREAADLWNLDGMDLPPGVESELEPRKHRPKEATDPGSMQAPSKEESLETERAEAKRFLETSGQLMEGVVNKARQTNATGTHQEKQQAAEELAATKRLATTIAKKFGFDK